MVTRKILLSTLWIVVLINMIYADILSLMDQASPIRRIIAGEPVPAGGLLMGAVLMETGIVMVILSQILNHRANRWVTSFICLINIIAVSTGGLGDYYVFFASIEIVCMLAIIWIAWQKPGKNSKLDNIFGEI